ncbi:phosphoglycolate phosphatase [Caulobacter ginsengisoli]|uniref:Phosphoglycolate phosphatase n=1 Tax=Caulobacter ginsengisoli TaxID=400775 RepID=A0ABU0IP87_9CAUL|nr:HAD-IA family hydrolase [Caulobacter ginsengisoli]MDQ0463774.1 phosphoglycolate phosphatase [Caulobacter ginsengisoli]
MRALEGWTIVFDLDGTLVETASDICAVLNDLLEEEGIPPLPYEQARLLVGRGARALVQRGFVAAGATVAEARLDELVDRFVDLYRPRLAEKSRPFPGCIEALTALREAGAIFCVCTNKRTELSVALFEALGMSHWFAAIVGPDAVGARKPDPNHLLAAIAQAGGDPARAIMVGDGEPDAGAARAAGVPLVIVDFGYTTIPAAELGGDILISHFSELADACRRLATCPAVQASL